MVKIYEIHQCISDENLHELCPKIRCHFLASTSIPPTILRNRVVYELDKIGVRYVGYDWYRKYFYLYK